MAARLDDTSVICIELHSWDIHTQYPLHILQYKRKLILDFRDTRRPHRIHSTMQGKEGYLCKETQRSSGECASSFADLPQERKFLSIPKIKNSYTKNSNRDILPVGEFINSLLSIVIIHYWGVATADHEKSGLTVNHKKGKKEGARV